MALSAWFIYDALKTAFETPETKDWWQKHAPFVAEAAANVTGMQIPQVNETIEAGGRGGKKRFIVVRRLGAYFLSVANSGSADGSIVRGLWTSMGSGIEIVRVRPVWVGKQAAARYAQYTDLMKRVGNEALIVPFTSAEKQPAEDPEPTPDSDADPDVTIRHRIEDGTVAIYPRNQEITKVIRRFGFVWAPTAGVMRRTNTVGVHKTPVPLGALRDALHRAGFRVAFDVAEAVTADERAAADERRRAYLRQRAAMIAERGQRAAQRSVAYAQRAGVGAKEALTNLEIAGYYPTPPELVARLIDAADIDAGDAVLEPSAGSGTLADAASAAGGEVDAIEINSQLRDYLRSLGYPIVATNILDFAPGAIYDVVVMNPPFERGQDIDHVRHAARLVKPGGRLVALVSSGAVQRSDRKAQDFRAWLESQGATIEILPPTTFGRATVSTALIVLEPQGEQAPQNDAQIAEVARARAAAEGATGDARAIAADLVSRASTSRRAQRSLERAERMSKQEAAYAATLAQRATAIERAAQRVGEVKAEPVRAPKARTPRPYADFDAAFRRIVKKEFGATLLRTDVNGYYVGFGPITTGWHGNRAEKEIRLLYPWRDRKIAQAYTSRSLTAKPAVELDVTDLPVEEAARMFAAQVAAHAQSSRA
jgi:protein-L-isoaspartate O-methyltransferase